MRVVITDYGLDNLRPVYETVKKINHPMPNKTVTTTKCYSRRGEHPDMRGLLVPDQDCKDRPKVLFFLEMIGYKRRKTIGISGDRVAKCRLR